MSEQATKLRPIGTIFKVERDISDSGTNSPYKKIIVAWEVVAHSACEEHGKQYYGEEIKCVGIEYV